MNGTQSRFDQNQVTSFSLNLNAKHDIIKNRATYNKLLFI